MRWEVSFDERIALTLSSTTDLNNISPSSSFEYRFNCFLMMKLFLCNKSTKRWIEINEPRNFYSPVQSIFHFKSGMIIHSVSSTYASWRSPYFSLSNLSSYFDFPIKIRNKQRERRTRVDEKVNIDAPNTAMETPPSKIEENRQEPCVICGISWFKRMTKLTHGVSHDWKSSFCSKFIVTHWDRERCQVSIAKIPDSPKK